MYPPNNGNITVFANFDYIHVSKLEEREGKLTSHLRFKMFWMDDRIKTNFSHKTEANTSYDVLKIDIKKDLKNSLGPPIWLPDYNFKNQLMQASVAEEFVLTDLNFLSQNQFHPSLPLIQIELDMRVEVLCTFKFYNYPLDSQTCGFTFRNDRIGHIKHSTHLSSKNQSQFDAAGFKFLVTMKNGRDDPNIKLGFILQMRRIVLSYILKSYIPTATIVLISGISFEIPVSDIPGRVMLSVTLFLTLTSIFMQTTVSVALK